MPDILIRWLDAAVVRRLKTRARRHGRSVQSEAKRMLERAAGPGGPEVAAMLQEWRTKLAGRKFSPSSRLLREDRKR